MTGLNSRYGQSKTGIARGNKGPEQRGCGGQPRADREAKFIDLTSTGGTDNLPRKRRWLPGGGGRGWGSRLKDNAAGWEGARDNCKPQETSDRGRKGRYILFDTKSPVTNHHLNLNLNLNAKNML